MAAALRSGELDAAMLLTEGAVAGVASGGGFGIASLYTESPLLWGIHVPAALGLHAVDDLEGARYAISRRGSGSHLMAFVHARARGWPTDDLDVRERRQSRRGRRGVRERRGRRVLLGKIHDEAARRRGAVSARGRVRAPWPAFVVCVADAVGAEQRAGAREAAGRRFSSRRTCSPRARTPRRFIGARYSLEPSDVAEWLRATRWARRVGIEAQRSRGGDDGARGSRARCRGDFEPAGALAPLARHDDSRGAALKPYYSVAMIPGVADSSPVAGGCAARDSTRVAEAAGKQACWSMTSVPLAQGGRADPRSVGRARGPSLRSSNDA